MNDVIKKTIKTLEKKTSKLDNNNKNSMKIQTNKKPLDVGFNFFCFEGYYCALKI